MVLLLRAVFLLPLNGLLEGGSVSAVAIAYHREPNVAYADEDQWLFDHCPDGAMVGDNKSAIDPPLHIMREIDKEEDVNVDYVKTWIPGYPGSGSAMLGIIINRLTGLIDTNAYQNDNCRSNRSISCKTHYPVLRTRTDGSWKDMDDGSVPVNGGYFMLLRNPAHSIPSYFNFRWERKRKHQMEHHTTQAPVEEWRKWRDRHLVREIKNWVNIIRTWDDSPLDVSLYLPFERLITPSEGPALVKYMALEFAKANSVPLSDDPTLLEVDMVPCLWRELVMDHPSMKRTSSYVPGFTTEQKTYMLHAVEDLMDWAADRPADVTGTTLVDILEGYHVVITSGLVIDGE